MAWNMKTRGFKHTLSQIMAAERRRPLTEDHRLLSVMKPCPELISEIISIVVGGGASGSLL
jgi:hypothetical protein